MNDCFQEKVLALQQNLREKISILEKLNQKTYDMYIKNPDTTGGLIKPNKNNIAQLDIVESPRDIFEPIFPLKLAEFLLQNPPQKESQYYTEYHQYYLQCNNLIKQCDEYIKYRSNKDTKEQKLNIFNPNILCIALQNRKKLSDNEYKFRISEQDVKLLKRFAKNKPTMQGGQKSYPNQSLTSTNEIFEKRYDYNQSMQLNASQKQIDGNVTFSNKNLFLTNASESHNYTNTQLNNNSNYNYNTTTTSWNYGDNYSQGIQNNDSTILLKVNNVNDSKNQLNYDEVKYKIKHHKDISNSIQSSFPILNQKQECTEFYFYRNNNGQIVKPKIESMQLSNNQFNSYKINNPQQPTTTHNNPQQSTTTRNNPQQPATTTL